MTIKDLIVKLTALDDQTSQVVVQSGDHAYRKIRIATKVDAYQNPSGKLFEHDGGQVSIGEVVTVVVIE